MKKTLPIVLLFYFSGILNAISQSQKLYTLETKQTILATAWQGETMLTASTDGLCRWWNSNGICRDSFNFESPIPKTYQAVFTKNAMFLLAQTSDSSFAVWDVPARVKIWENSVGCPGITNLAISENNHFMSAACKNQVVLFDSTGLEIERFSHEKTPVSISISNTGVLLVAYPGGDGVEKTVKIWGPKNGQKEQFQKPTVAEKLVEPPVQTAKSAEIKTVEVDFLDKNPSAVIAKKSNYAVVAGTFGQEINARRRLADVKEWGFSNARLERKNQQFTIIAAEFATHDDAWKVKKNLEDKYGISAAVVRQK